MNHQQVKVSSLNVVPIIDLHNFCKRVWYPLLKHLNYEARTPYQSRHTAATLWLASGEAPEWIARQLGHANTEMLFTVYSRFVPNLTRQDGSAFERLLLQSEVEKHPISNPQNHEVSQSDSSYSAFKSLNIEDITTPLLSKSWLKSMI